MSEQLAPPLEVIGNDLPGGLGNYPEMFPALKVSESNGLSVDFVDKTGEPRTIKLAPDEQYVLGPYGSSGEAREPFIIKTDSDEAEVKRVPFTDFVESREKNEVESSKESAAKQVFTGVAKRLSNVASRGKTSRNVLQTNPATGELTTVAMDVNPAKEFVEGYFSGLDKIQGVVGNTEYTDVALQLKQELKDINLEDETIRRGEAVIGHEIARTNKLVSLGRVDRKTAQYFWASLPLLKSGLSLNYNSLVSREGSLEGTIDQIAYQRGLDEALTIFEGRTAEQESGGFIHVNSELSLVEGHKPIERLYISSRADGDPSRVIKIWSEMLDELGLKDSVYFKVPQAIEGRYEGLVMYRLDSMSDEDFTQLVEEFVKRCPSELLDPEPMPTGTEVIPGIFTAPEPRGLNELLRYATRKDAETFDMISYNQLAGGMSELAFRLAASDFREKGIDQSQITPAQLAEAAEPYFSQLMILSGIDPETMMDRSGREPLNPVSARSSSEGLNDQERNGMETKKKESGRREVVLTDWSLASEIDGAGIEQRLEALTQNRINHLIVETDDGQMYEIKSFFIPEDSISLNDQRFSLTSTVANKDRDLSRPKIEMALTKNELEKTILTVGEQLVLGLDSNGKRKKSRGVITKMTRWSTNRASVPPDSERRDGVEESDVQQRFARAVHDTEPVPRQIHENMEDFREKINELIQTLEQHSPEQHNIDPSRIILTEEDFRTIEDIRFTTQEILDSNPRIQDGTIDKLLSVIPQGFRGDILRGQDDFDTSEMFQLDENVDGFEVSKDENGENIIKLDKSTMQALMLRERLASAGEHAIRLKRRKYPRNLIGSETISTRKEGRETLHKALANDIRKIYIYS